MCPKRKIHGSGRTCAPLTTETGVYAANQKFIDGGGSGGQPLDEIVPLEECDSAYALEGSNLQGFQIRSGGACGAHRRADGWADVSEAAEDDRRGAWSTVWIGGFHRTYSSKRVFFWGAIRAGEQRDRDEPQLQQRIGSTEQRCDGLRQLENHG